MGIVISMMIAIVIITITNYTALNNNIILIIMIIVIIICGSASARIHIRIYCNFANCNFGKTLDRLKHILPEG